MDELPQIRKLSMADEETVADVDRCGGSDGASVSSDESDGSVIEPFADYKIKIEQLLDSIGLQEFDIEVIQHGYDFMNCVYALTSSHATEQYILRVATGGFIRESDGRHETVENEVVILGHLRDKLPVPRIKAYSLTTDNALEAAYTIQTKIAGESLNHLWASMSVADKCAIVDEFLGLLVKLESVEFGTAGTFAVSGTLLPKSNDFTHTEEPLVRIFDAFADEPTEDPKIVKDRAGPDVKSLLTSHFEKWTQEEYDNGQHELSCALTPRFEKLHGMLEDMTDEATFKDQPFPVVLHHWDLEPRNLMVSKASGAWKICGVIDWDDAVALPRPLARVPPRWIWHFPDEDPDIEDGYLNDDQYPDPELSSENKALKAYFDEKVETVLPGYTEDAYGRGRWLRRIWYFAKTGAYRQYEWEFLDQLPKDWAARPQRVVGTVSQMRCNPNFCFCTVAHQRRTLEKANV